MFLDGLMYASIAKNLAMNHGEFWNLYYTDTFYTQFNEHPPLVFGLQGMFFKLFGDHTWVERSYSLGTYAVVSYFMYKIWIFFGKKKSTFWLPMLFLALIPLMTWSTANNMLENTMSVFTCASIYFYLRSTKGARYYYLTLCSLMVLFAFLSKGFTGLYVLTFPFFYDLSVGKRHYLRGLLDSVFVILLTVLFLSLLFYLNEDAYQSFLRYYQRQVVGSIENIVTVKSRYYIATKLITELLIPGGVMLVIYLWSRKAKIPLSDSTDRKKALSLVVFGLCGVLPIMVSMKQSGFYIVTTFPFFAIALSLLILNGLKTFQLKVLLPNFKVIKVGSVVLIVSCVVLFFIAINRIGRDEERIEMISNFDDLIEDGSTVFIDKDMWSDWSMHAYFSRLKDVSLSADPPSMSSLYLSKEVLGGDFELTLRSGTYFLYRKK